MADYPATIYTPRVVANAPLVVFDASKTTIGYAEDVNLSNDEIVAIQDTLGLNPQGSYADVVTRLNQYTSYDQSLNTTNSVKFNNIIVDTTDASTNTVLTLLDLKRRTSGIGATGIGARLALWAENSSGVITELVRFSSEMVGGLGLGSLARVAIKSGGSWREVMTWNDGLVTSLDKILAPQYQVSTASYYLSITGGEIALTDPVSGTKKLSQLFGFLSQAEADALYPAIDNPFITIGNPANLSDERALTAGANITLTDGGAGSTATLKSRSLITVGNGFQSTSYIVATTGVELYGFMYPGSNLVAGTLTHTCKVAVVAIVGTGTWTIDLLDKTNTTTVATIASISTTGIKTLTVTGGNVPTDSALFDVKVTVVGGSGTRTIVLGAVEFETQGY